MIVAIDGPTASGKGTVAKKLAERLGIANLCTGSIYRAITIYFLENKIHHNEMDKIADAIERINIDVQCVDGDTRVLVEGKDVTKDLHDILISSSVAEYAKLPIVRHRVKYIQNQIAAGKSLVCEGRDITSVIFPDARFKFYIDAKLSVRAKRRWAQEVAIGEVSTFQSVREGIRTRDHLDMTRNISPLRKVRDAKIINSTKMTADQVVDKIARIIERGLAHDEEFTKRHPFTPRDFKKPFGAGFVRWFLKVIVFLPFCLVYPTWVFNKKEMKKHRGKPVIIALNHKSNADGFMTFYAFKTRYLNFIGKESLFRPHSFSNWILRIMNVVPIRPGRNELPIIRHSLHVLGRGQSLVIFPEGRRNFSAETALEVRDGTAVIAMKAGVPVVPVVINRRAKLFRLTKFRIGNTIYPDKIENKKEFSNVMRAEMARLLDGFEHVEKQPKWDTVPVDNVRAIMFHNNKIALIKRNRDGADYYVFPGGHLEENEAPRDAVVREMREETNLVTEPVRCLYKKTFGKEMQAFYLLNYKSGEVSKTDAEEYTTDADKRLNRADGKPDGTYEPVEIPMTEIANTDIRPHEIRDQLARDIEKYTMHLGRPTILVK